MYKDINDQVRRTATRIKKNVTEGFLDISFINKYYECIKLMNTYNNYSITKIKPIIYYKRIHKYYTVRIYFSTDERLRGFHELNLRN